MASRRLVQYVVLRGDLQSSYEWPAGALIAQACHATTAVMHLYRDDENVVEYAKDLDNMHKVVLKAKDQESLEKLAEKLKDNQVDHKLWIEQPENIATCIATKPYPKEDIQQYFKKFNLFK